MKLTSKDNTDVWEALQDVYGSKVTLKSTSLFMWAIGILLSLIGIMTTEAFRNRFTTTVNRTIYLPYPLAKADPWRGIKLAVHEHTHIGQMDKIGKIAFVWRYMYSTRGRAIIEAEAYASGIRLGAYLGQPAPDTKRLAYLLFNYGCDPSDVEYAKGIYDVALRNTLRPLTGQASRIALEALGV